MLLAEGIILLFRPSVVFKKLLLLICELVVSIEVLYPRGLGLWRDLITKLGSGDLFPSPALGNTVEDKLMRCGNVR